MWLKILRPLAFLALAAGVGSGIVSSQGSYSITSYSPRPGGCATAGECQQYCAAHPAECQSYCGIDSAHARECASWSGITIASETYSHPPDSGSYTPPTSGSYTPPSSNSSYTPPPTSYTPPTSPTGETPTGSYTTGEASCRATPNCTWTGNYCDCKTSSGTYSPAPPGTGPETSPYASEANCKATPNCSWVNNACGCTVSSQPPSSESCKSAGYNWCYSAYGGGWCDYSRNGCGSTGGSDIPQDKPACEARGYTWCVAQDTNKTSWCDTLRHGCTGAGTGPGGGGSCYLNYPSVRSDVNCRAAATAYIGCTPTYEDQKEHDRLTAECVAGGIGTTPTPTPTPLQCPAVACSAPLVSCVIPGSGSSCPTCTTSAACGTTTPTPQPQPPRPRDCALPRCSILEVTCNPPNDGNECAVCMTPQACRESFEGGNKPQPPQPPEPPKPIQPPGPIGPPGEVPRPECKSDEDCARYCFSGGPQQQVCTEFCSAGFSKAECQRWADAYARLRGGKIRPPGDEDRGDESDPARLAQMKKSFQQWLREFRNIEGRVNRIKARGVTIPEEVTAAVATIKGINQSIETATTVEELMALGEKIQDSVQTINESLPGLEQLQEFNKHLRTVNRDLSRAESQFKRIARRAKLAKVDESLLEATAQQIAEAKQQRDAAVAAAKEGKAEEAFDALEAVVTALDEIREKISGLEAVLSAPRELARARRELTRFDRELRSLERRDADTTEARALLAELNAKLSAIAELIAQRPFPAVEVFEAIQDFEDAKDQFLLVLDDLRGTRREIFPVPVPSGGGVPLELPEGFGHVDVPKDVFGIQ